MGKLMELISGIESLYIGGMSIDPLTLDFAALRTLRLVHALGSFSRAAETLNITQPTVSYTMARLRDAFGDPLFVRQGSGIIPTARCSEIVLQISQLLDQFEALSAPPTIDPTRAEIEIRISCNYYERVTLIPELVRVLRREAPGIRLHIISSTVRGKEQLMRSESDIVIGPIQIEGAGFYRRSLLKDSYVCVMDPSNPLAQGPLTVDQFCAAPQVIVHYGGNFRSRFLVDMADQGLAPNAVMNVPSPANLTDFLLGNDLIATVPRRIAQTFGPAVAILPCPFPGQISIDLYWTARTHVSAPHVWFRSQIAAAAARLGT